MKSTIVALLSAVLLFSGINALHAEPASNMQDSEVAFIYYSPYYGGGLYRPYYRSYYYQPYYYNYGYPYYNYYRGYGGYSGLGGGVGFPGGGVYFNWR